MNELVQDLKASPISKLEELCILEIVRESSCTMEKQRKLDW